MNKFRLFLHRGPRQCNLPPSSPPSSPQSLPVHDVQLSDLQPLHPSPRQEEHSGPGNAFWSANSDLVKSRQVAPAVCLTHHYSRCSHYRNNLRSCPYIPRTRTQSTAGTIQRRKSGLVPVQDLLVCLCQAERDHLDRSGLSLEVSHRQNTRGSLLLDKEEQKHFLAGAEQLPVGHDCLRRFRYMLR